MMTRGKSNTSRDTQQQQPDCAIEKVRQNLQKGPPSMSDLGSALLSLHDLMKEMKDKCLEALQEKVNVLEDKVKDQGDTIIKLANRVKDLEGQVGDAKKMEDRVLDMEWKEVQNNLRLHNVPLHEDKDTDMGERHQQTKEQVTKFLSSINIREEDFGAYSCRRLRGMNKTPSGQKPRPPQIQIKLTGTWQKGVIFRALKQNGKSTSVSVKDEYPASLAPLRKKLAAQGEEFKKENKDNRFRILRQGRTLTLQKKSAEDHVFVDA